LTKASERKILAFERKCYGKIMQIGWSKKVLNEELYSAEEIATV